MRDSGEGAAKEGGLLREWIPRTGFNVDCVGLVRSAGALGVEGVAALVGSTAEPAPGEGARLADHVGASTVALGPRLAVGALLAGLLDRLAGELLGVVVIGEHHSLVLLRAGEARVGVLTAKSAVGVLARVAVDVDTRGSVGAEASGRGVGGGGGGGGC